MQPKKMSSLEIVVEIEGSSAVHLFKVEEWDRVSELEPWLRALPEFCFAKLYLIYEEHLLNYDRFFGSYNVPNQYVF